MRQEQNPIQLRAAQSLVQREWQQQYHERENNKMKVLLNHPELFDQISEYSRMQFEHERQMTQLYRPTQYALEDGENQLALEDDEDKYDSYSRAVMFRRH